MIIMRDYEKDMKRCNNDMNYDDDTSISQGSQSDEVETVSENDEKRLNQWEMM